MEDYRRMIYRYSTGQGPIVNVGMPNGATDYASFKMDPLVYKQDRPGFAVELKREADRVSMQLESAEQMMKVLGYNSKAGAKYQNLKNRVEVIKHLLVNYPVKFIKSEDLEKLYGFYAQGHPAMDVVIKKVVKENKKVKGAVPDFVGTAYGVRKGYPLFDAYGNLLTPQDKALFEKSKNDKPKTLSGFDGVALSVANKLPIILVAAAIAYYYIFVHKK